MLLLTQIETILTSRPLTAPSTDVNDHLALTPGHFIFERLITPIPEPSPKNNTLSRHWRNIDKKIRQFWMKWSVEYFSSLQQRDKWRTEQVQQAVDDIVIIKEEKTQPMCWPLARIIQTMDGNDNKDRVQPATIYTESFFYEIDNIPDYFHKNQVVSVNKIIFSVPSTVLRR